MQQSDRGSSRPSADRRRCIAWRTSRRALMGTVGAGVLAAVGHGVPGALAQTGQAPSPSNASVVVFPAPGTWTASPHTEISFRGISPEELGPVTVIASESGGHSGVMKPHGDGNGVSFVPDARFDAGEIVTVDAGIPLGGDDGLHRFGVVRDVELVPAPEDRVTDEPEETPHAFRSRPELRPPVIEITQAAAGTGDGYIFLTTNVPNGQIGLTILDDDGAYIWFNPPAVDTGYLYDLRVQEYQGQPVLTWVEGASPVGFGFGHFVIADNTYQILMELQVGNGFPGGDVHEFRLTDRGTALVILYHPVEWDLSPVGGSRYAPVMDNIIQELEVETGRVLFEWHALDHIAMEETYKTREPGADGPFDYFHLNSVTVAPDGDLIISARHTFGIYKIGYLSGDVIWRLGGRTSDFAMNAGTEFAWQHDAHLFPNGHLTLFDNAESDQDLADEAHSRGMVLEIDEDAMTATLAKEYVHPREILSVSQGNMQTLPNDNRFVGWGSAPVFSEFSANGELLFNGRLPQGANSYRAYRFPWVGQPVNPPDIAVEAGGGSALTVYASWNGATEVDTWRVLAGRAPANLTPLTTVDRDGFETAIEVETDAAYVAVEALNEAGAIIGASEAVQSGA